MKQLFDTFRARTHIELAKESLEEAQRELLQDQARAEYHNAMVSYHQTRIERLKKYIENHSAQGHHHEKLSSLRKAG